jgi:hypothetical protein
MVFDRLAVSFIMTEGRQPFTAEIKTLAKGPSTYDPLENTIDAQQSSAASSHGSPIARPLAHARNWRSRPIVVSTEFRVQLGFELPTLQGASVLCVRDLFDPTADLHYGRVVKRTGDGALVGFRSVVDALRSTSEVRNAGLRA